MNRLDGDNADTGQAMRRAWYLRCGPDDVGTHAILVGDRGRVWLGAELLTGARFLNEDRGLTTVTGEYAGRRVTISAFGMGAPIAAVVLHELAGLGVGTFIRLGTVLGLPPVRLGDLVLAHGAVRGESTSHTYLPVEFPAVPDPDLYHAARDTLSGLARTVRTGVYASYDGFYTQMFPPGPDDEHRISERIVELRRAGVAAIDMETSALLIAGRKLGVRTASLCLASVDGLSHARLDDAEREDAERDLMKAGLAVLAAAPGTTTEGDHR